MRKRIGKFFAENPIVRATCVFIVALIVVYSFSASSRDYYDDDKEEFFKNIRVEAHGMVLDLLVIGVFVFGLNSLGEQRRTIKRYREEIEDYLGWEEPEATFRIVGNIKRLNRKGVSDIKLVGAYLRKANLKGANLKKADLWGANLKRANLGGAKLMKAKLGRADLRRAKLGRAFLMDADLERADLEGAFLIDADLKGANLELANLTDAIVTPEQLAMAKSLEGATMPKYKAQDN